MNVAALIETLEASGVDAATIVAAIKAAASGGERSSAAVRQARYRANKAERNACDVTRDVTAPPKRPSELNSKPTEVNQNPHPPISPRPDAGEALLLEAGVQPETIREWKLTRKAKRAGPITPLVAKGQIREAAAAGMTPEAATLLCIERGWQAFRAEYGRNRQTGPPRQAPRSTAADFAAELEALSRGPHDPHDTGKPDPTLPRLAYSAAHG